jgi:hypothetical protein
LPVSPARLPPRGTLGSYMLFTLSAVTTVHTGTVHALGGPETRYAVCRADQAVHSRARGSANPPSVYIPKITFSRVPMGPSYDLSAPSPGRSHERAAPTPWYTLWRRNGKSRQSSPALYHQIDPPTRTGDGRATRKHELRPSVQIHSPYDTAVRLPASHLATYPILPEANLFLSQTIDSPFSVVLQKLHGVMFSSIANASVSPWVVARQMENRDAVEMARASGAPRVLPRLASIMR